MFGDSVSLCSFHILPMHKDETVGKKFAVVSPASWAPPPLRGVTVRVLGPLGSVPSRFHPVQRQGGWTYQGDQCSVSSSSPQSLSRQMRSRNLSVEERKQFPYLSPGRALRAGALG